MAPGQHPGAAHLAGQTPGGGMVQQMHPGVSGPGVPQVSQAGAMVSGMQPVVGTTGPGGPVPNAHAMSHLNPAQQHHLMQQQQLAHNFANNPQLLQQQQHQQYLRQRQIFLQQQQQHQQQQAQQGQPQPQQAPPQQHGAIPATLPNGTQPVSTAHMATVRTANPIRPINIPPHLQQQMQAHGHHPQPPNIHQQQQQYIAMQMAAQQAQQQSNQQRAGVQPQGMHDAQAMAQHPQTQPPSQGSTSAPQMPPNTQSLPPSSQPTQQVPQVHQQQGQNAQTQPPQQHPQQNPQQPQPPMTAQEAQIRAQQHSAGSGMFVPQRMTHPVKRSFSLRLFSFAEYLSNYSRNPSAGLAYWQSFVEQFYSPAGVLRQGVWNAQTGTKQFEILTPALARYYWTQFNSGIKHIQMIVENTVERDLPTGGQIVESPRSCFIYWFENGCQLVSQGSLRAQFDINGKIDMLDIATSGNTEYIPRHQLQRPESPDQTKSPKAGKGANKKTQQKTSSGQNITIPESMVTDDGVPVAVMRFLEVAEIMSQMQGLFQFSLQHPHLSPPEALRQLVATFQPQNQGVQTSQGHPSQLGPGQRTPLNGPPQFPQAAAHLGMTGAQGSPHLGAPTHTPSPAQNAIAGSVAMAQQQSQQGTNTSGSQGPSANASPNVGHKRRRTSTVKLEGDDATPGGEVNGNAPPNSSKVKASPRVPKRQKGAS
ncbi:hypothetical protein VTO42DRAFT_1177 [Malbranchea cinnamomea]